MRADNVAKREVKSKIRAELFMPFNKLLLRLSTHFVQINPISETLQSVPQETTPQKLGMLAQQERPKATAAL